MDFSKRRSSSSPAMLPDALVTMAMEAWEVTAATDRTREADRGSSLISPLFFSCKNSRSRVRKSGHKRQNNRRGEGIDMKGGGREYN